MILQTVLFPDPFDKPLVARFDQSHTSSDGNDAEHLADDPIHKLLLGRDPLTGDLLLQRRHRIRPVPTESQNRTRNPTPVCTPPT